MAGKVDAVYCLGDLGGFGPSPESVRPLLAQGDVRLVQGNYEESLASGAEDCNCGYTDPRDNHFAELSYRYTEAHCSDGFKAWMGEQPKRRRVLLGDRELLLVHGSPRRSNEFLFRSTTPVPYLETLLDQEGADALLCTHTGLHWHRRLPSGRDAVNVGVIGRPANDGRTNVWYAVLEAPRANGGGDRPAPLGVDLRPLAYDHASLAAEMRREELPLSSSPPSRPAGGPPASRSSPPRNARRRGSESATACRRRNGRPPRACIGVAARGRLDNRAVSLLTSPPGSALSSLRSP